MSDLLDFAIPVNQKWSPYQLDPGSELAFILAGKAIFTIRNAKTDKRYTYRVQQPDPQPGDTRTPPHFVGILNGPDNTRDYAYAGTIFPNEPTVIRATAKSHPSFRDGPAVKGLGWLLRRLYAGVALPEEVQIFHEGRCGRCGRRLTTPESVARGIGPECADKM